MSNLKIQRDKKIYFKIINKKLDFTQTFQNIF